MAENYSSDQTNQGAQRQNIFRKDVEKVGVIIIHGIGEQKRFEFLEGETRKIVDAIIANYGQRRRDVTPTLTTGTGDSYRGEQASWASGREAPLHCLVELDEKIVDIAFHEVWWADINEPLTLGKQVRFWAWGLSLAGIAEHNTKVLPGATERTRPPRNHGKISLWNRGRMAYVSILFGFSAFSIALVNLILKRLNFKPFPLTSTIVNYLSGVKIYSQDERAGGSPMDGPDEPPRAAIRRRMIRTMTEVATAGYDRWYILAHSLGTVVAWNGLMEIQRALPNYLSPAQWNSKEVAPLRGTAPTPFDINAMMPNRPLWLDNQEIIRRDVLFEKFRGIVTYGSPLERFCALWSAMVPLNKQEDVFRRNDEWSAEWVNVYDPTDPVGTWLDDYDPQPVPPSRQGHTKLTPQNFPCRASGILLASHLAYFNAPKQGGGVPHDGKFHLVNQVAHWLIQGDSLTKRLDDAPKDTNSFWMPRATTQKQTRQFCFPRVLRALSQEVLVGALLTVVTILSLNRLVFPLLKTAAKALIGFLSRFDPSIPTDAQSLYSHFPNRPNFLAEVFWLWIFAAIVVCLASIYHRYRSTKVRNRLSARTLQQKSLQEKSFV
jgi:hypothetical protein